MYSLLDEINEIMWIIGLLSICFGAVNCFFGYKLYKLVIALNGFVFGSIIGGILGLIGVMYLEISDDTVAVIVFTGLICGAISSFIAFSTYKLGVFMMNFFIVFVASLAFLLSDMSAFELLFIDESELLGYVISASIPAFIAGVVAVIFIKPSVILTTAVSGAYEIARGIGTIMDDNNFCFIAAVILAIIGIAVQFITNRSTSTGYITANKIKPVSDSIPDESAETAVEELCSDAEVITDFSDTREIFEAIISEPDTAPIATESKLKLSADIKKKTFSDSCPTENKSEHTSFSAPDDL